MDLATTGSLVVLALVDSTSIGTLLLPIWLLLAPGGVRMGRMLLYLGTIAGFYLIVGTAVALGVDAVAAPVGRALDGPAGIVAQLGLGLGLIGLSFVVDPGRRARERRAGVGRDPARRVLRWRDRAVAGGGRPRALVLLALGAGTVEVATMVPYLAAISLVSTSDLPPAGRVAVLAAYCLVMVLPASVVTALRLVAARGVDPLLQRLGEAMMRSAASTTGWVLGIAGFLVAADAVGRADGLGRLLGT